MNPIISANNRSILNPLKTNYGCNCRDKNKCRLKNQCLTPNIVYQENSYKNDGIIKKVIKK